MYGGRKQGGMRKLPAVWLVCPIRGCTIGKKSKIKTKNREKIVKILLKVIKIGKKVQKSTNSEKSV